MSASAGYDPTGRAILGEAIERLGESADYLLHTKSRLERIVSRLDDFERIDGDMTAAILEVVGGVESTLRLADLVMGKART